MQVVKGVSAVDLSTMADRETALAEVEDGRFVRVWKRGRNVRVTLPLLEEELSTVEKTEVAQYKLGIGGPV